MFKSHCIVLLLAMLAGPVAHGQSAHELEQAMLRGEYERAVKIAETLAERQPTSSVAAYNAGCACSRAGEHDRAIEWLLKAAQLGYAGTRSIRDADHLDPVRSHARFQEVVDAVAANARARFERFRTAAEQHEPTVILPPKHDPEVAAPLLVVLHGTGGDGKGIAQSWKQAAASVGAIIVAPDALRPVRGTDGFSWVYRDEAEWFILHTIDEAKKKWKIGPVVLAGFSQGANIALMLGQSHPDRFQAVIPVCGHYENDVAELPTEGDRPRWCLLIGERDRWARTYIAGERDFKKAGMTVRRDVVKGMGHSMPRGRRMRYVR